ncbi:MAG: TIGR02300 family protein [Rhizobiales bacterium]|nr:TIGR02300 family protein [Hyphomicrobiales bacterium]
MATPEAGTKRVCPETGKKFYDLNKDPIVSPYTGESYPRAFFETEKIEAVKHRARAKVVPEAEADDDEDEDDEIVDDVVEVVSLEEADAEVEEDDALPGIEDEEDTEIEIDDDDDTFLEPDEDEDDDVSDLLIDADDNEKDL